MDSSRKFAASFALAWNFWLARFGTFLRMLWLPCLVAGAVCAAWWAMRSSLFSYGVNVLEMVVDVLGGALLLFVWSMMRTMQSDLLQRAVEDGGDSSAYQTLKLSNIPKIVRLTWRPYLPLLVVWVVAYLLVYLPLHIYRTPVYIVGAAAVIALLVLPPVGGLVQSYMEAKPERPLLRGVKEGLALNRRYLGSMLALWVIALLMLAVVMVMLLFGNWIIDSAYANRRQATLQEEVIVLPAYLPLLRYSILVLGVWIVSFLHTVWSLPQQVHIRSIIYKLSKHNLS